MPTFTRSPAGFAVLALGLLAVGGCGSDVAEPPNPEPRLAASRAAAMQLGTELKSRLTQVMGEQGPVAAVAVCAEEAPAIAARLSAETGATVGRTALRLRNPGNAAEGWQIDILKSVADQMAAGADPGALEYSQTTGSGGFRYMKAIATSPACLACHGDVPAGALADALENNYPDDLATGFSVGELRGAFVVEWNPES